MINTFQLPCMMDGVQLGRSSSQHCATWHVVTGSDWPDTAMQPTPAVPCKGRKSNWRSAPALPAMEMTVRWNGETWNSHSVLFSSPASPHQDDSLSSSFASSSWLLPAT